VSISTVCFDNDHGTGDYRLHDVCHVSIIFWSLCTRKQENSPDLPVPPGVLIMKPIYASGCY